MALSQQCRDWAYLLIVGTQLFGMLGESSIVGSSPIGSPFSLPQCFSRVQLLTQPVLDLVAFYPKSLWQAPSAPLHFLVSLRETYVSLSGDPFFAHPHHEPWFEAFLYVEAAAQLPLAAYLVYRLATARATAGATELAGLAFGCLTGMGSVVVCYHLWQLGEDVVGAQQKMMLFYGEYLPFAVIRELLI